MFHIMTFPVIEFIHFMFLLYYYNEYCSNIMYTTLLTTRFLRKICINIDNYSSNELVVDLSIEKNIKDMRKMAHSMFTYLASHLHTQRREW